jgi:putative transposase
MSSYRQIYYHIVFGTKNHKPTLPDVFSEEIYKYIWGIIKNKNCKLYRINGCRDHIHILSDLHPSLALADYIKDIKIASSVWIKGQGKYQNFEGWAEGYAAITISHSDRDSIIEYIKNQKEHHKIESFIDEYRQILKEYGIDFDEKYFL